MNEYPFLTWVYFGFFALAAVTGFFCTAISIRFARRYKFLDYPGPIKLHGRPTPYLGGVAIFASFWSVLWLVSTLLQSPPVRSGLSRFIPPDLGIQLTGAGSLWPGILGCGALILLLGLIDDRWVLKYYLKFIGQVVVAVLMVRCGLHIQFFSGLGLLGDGITVFWIVLLLNAFNFIDSVNGHCSGVVLIACGTYFIVSQFVDQPAIGIVMAVLAGSIVGFMPFNFHHARTFLGDNGSLFLGYMMAIVSLLSSYKSIQPVMMTPAVPLFVFGVPIYDLMSVVCVRLYRGMAPWRGDRNHFAHRLVRMGMKGHDAVFFSYIVAMATGLIAILSTQITSMRGHAITFLLYLLILMIIAILEYHSVVLKDSGDEKR